MPHCSKAYSILFLSMRNGSISREKRRGTTTVEGEDQATRTCKSETFIPKIMILTAISRPRYDEDKKCTFDGKIECFPLVTFEPAKRSSANRPAGT